jgi:hypothetical protein
MFEHLATYAEASDAATNAGASDAASASGQERLISREESDQPPAPEPGKRAIIYISDGDGSADSRDDSCTYETESDTAIDKAASASTTAKSKSMPKPKPKPTKAPEIDSEQKRQRKLGLERKSLSKRFTEMEKKHQDLLDWVVAKEEKDIADKQGQDLLVAMQKRHEGEVAAVFAEEALDCKIFIPVDASGMSALHYACRAVRLDWVTKILHIAPQLVDVLTFLGRTPSQWSCLNCAADVPKPNTQDGLEEHAAMFDILVHRALPDTIANVTGYGTTIVHQLAARGHIKTLERVLPRMESKLGKERFVALMDFKVGLLELGSVDTALRANIEVAKLLKKFGASEQVVPPEDWASSRRRATASTHNERSDSDQKRGSRSSRSRWEFQKEEGYGGYSGSSGGYKQW